ncbi:MAG: hypothetical protein CISAcid_06150 [uncultured Acidilobus sp. CIS]|jgi:hypothetical protein|nr:MAG: hypothetical protein CISAcid_06150 [uncultured Acidilobus sp. CIS]
MMMRTRARALAALKGRARS